MTKHTNESFDIILDEFNKLNNTDFVRVDDYRGVNEDIKLYNRLIKEGLKNVFIAPVADFTHNEISHLECLANFNKYKKILVVGTGSLHSVISSNQKVAMPGVSHAVSLEVL